MDTVTPLPPEPTFTLRARDEGAADALLLYAQLAADRGSPADYVAQVRATAAAFRAYPVSQTPGTWVTGLEAPPAGTLPPPAPVKEEGAAKMSTRG